MKQVSVVGRAKLNDQEVIKLAQQAGKIIAEAGYNLVCGGLGGVMLESCRGFKSTHSTGSTVGIIPSYNAATANEFIDVVIPTGLDIGRNQLVVASGFAVVVIGGGAGTLSEIALASQINKPVLLIKGSGGWADQLTSEYLDERKNTRLYHIHNMLELKNTLSELDKNLIDRIGLINDGHNNAAASTR